MDIGRPVALESVFEDLVTEIVYLMILAVLYNSKALLLSKPTS
jgi:hypothetical protein